MITIVSGFQRCGSSLVLQMLHAAGVPVFHDAEMGYPAFETMRQWDRDAAWLEPLDGYALKWLEPLANLPAAFPHEIRVIWMKRDYDQQAKSAVKFMRHVGGMQVPNSAADKMSASYRKDEAASLDAWRQHGQVSTFNFESLIESPHSFAMAVSLFLGIPLDTKEMAGQVRRRLSRCLPGFLELDLIHDAALVEQGNSK